MSYQVQRGDTIAEITQRFNISWNKLRQMNPDAVGRSRKTGRWFLKEGANIRVKDTFDTVLKNKLGQTAEQATNAPAQHTPISSSSDANHNASQSRWTEYTIKPGDNLWTLAVKRFHVNLEDLIRDNSIRNPELVRPGQKIRVRLPAPQPVQQVVASWYGKRYHGKTMANGEPYNMYANTIAHKDLPFGTRVELKNLETGQTEKAVVTDRGPFIAGRDVDLSYALANRLSLLKKGVGKLEMKVL